MWPVLTPRPALLSQQPQGPPGVGHALIMHAPVTPGVPRWRLRSCLLLDTSGCCLNRSLFGTCLVQREQVNVQFPDPQDVCGLLWGGWPCAKAPGHTSAGASPADPPPLASCKPLSSHYSPPILLHATVAQVVTETTTIAVVKWMHQIVNSIVDHLSRCRHPTSRSDNWRTWIKESVIVYLHNANVLHGDPRRPQLFYRGAHSGPEGQEETVWVTKRFPIKHPELDVLELCTNSVELSDRLQVRSAPGYSCLHTVRRPRASSLERKNSSATRRPCLQLADRVCL